MTLYEISPWIESMVGVFGFQLALSVCCGAIVGIERQVRGKAIEIRKATLICLATQVFIWLCTTIPGEGVVVDPTRVMGQVVTGVGFLGAAVVWMLNGNERIAKAHASFR